MSRKGIPGDPTIRPGMKTIYSDQGQGGVRYEKDIVYAVRGERELHIQMLHPGTAGDGGTGTGKNPLIVYVEGSAWGVQDCYSFLPCLYPAARAGYVVASVEHRSSEEARFPAFLQDVKTAIRFLRANSERYGIDPERVAVWGGSSGGHAALMVGLTGDMEEFKTDEYREQSDSVRAVVDFFGPTDVTRINETPRDPDYDLDAEQPEDRLLGGRIKEYPELAAPGNPLNYVTPEKEIPPILIAHGDEDGVVPFRQSVLMYDKLVECGKTAEFYKVLGGGHGAFVWTEELLDNVCRFLGICLR